MRTGSPAHTAPTLVLIASPGAGPTMELIEASQPRVGIHSLPSELLDFIVSLVPGRGIIALSLVNKGLRRLALPFFLQASLRFAPRRPPGLC